MSNKATASRRTFLKASAFTVAPLILPSRIFGADAPSKRINIGMIGIGRQAYNPNLTQFLGEKDCHVMAVCDVDAWRMEQGRLKVQEYYAKRNIPSSCKTYKDFRDLLADKDIDAVMISTPDHWHTPMAVAAVLAGKDVALEKPITRYIDEGRLLASLCEKHKRIFRVDSEFRSREAMHKAAELVRNGRIGTVRVMRTGSPTEVFPNESEEVTPPPADLDYNMWLGPAPEVAYIQKRVHTPRNLKTRPGWMRNLDYCDGMITNWGTHLNDIAQWGNGTERTGPVEVKATGVFHAGKVWNVLEKFDAWYRFENGCELFYQMGEPHVRFEGEKGWIQVNYSGREFGGSQQLNASDPALLADLGPDTLRFPLKSEKRDFLDSVKARTQTLEDAEVGQRTTSLCHIAHACIKRGGVKLRWDPVKEVFPDDAEANALLKRPPMRAPWKMG